MLKYRGFSVEFLLTLAFPGQNVPKYCQMKIT